MLRPPRFLTLLLGAVLAAPAGPAPTLLPLQSELAFTNRQMGVPVSGRFRRFETRLDFDPRRPEAAHIRVAVDLASVAFGTTEIEAELARPGWFDSGRQAQASFESSAVKALGAQRFEVRGRLALKGRTRELVVPITLATAAGGATTASGSFVVKRLDFGIGDGEWGDTALVADEVQVRFRFALAGLEAGGVR